MSTWWTVPLQADRLHRMGALPQPDISNSLGDILAICQKINSERDLASLLDVIAREATRLLDCDRASIFLLDRRKNELWSKVALGSDEIFRFRARSEEVRGRSKCR